MTRRHEGLFGARGVAFSGHEKGDCPRFPIRKSDGRAPGEHSDCGHGVPRRLASRTGEGRRMTPGVDRTIKFGDLRPNLGHLRT